MKIRFADVADAEAILAIYKPYVQSGTQTFAYDVPSIDEIKQQITTTLRNYPYLVCMDEHNETIGYAYASSYKAREAYQWDVETSIYLNASMVSQGIGRMLYHVLLEMLAYQNIYHAYACITYPNEASIRLHEHFSFQPVGIFHKCGYKAGQWLDVMWMEHTIHEPTGTPEPFRPLSTIPMCEITRFLTLPARSPM